MSAPETTGSPLPTQAQLAAAVRTASTRRVERYVDTATDQMLMETPPVRGTIVKETVRPGTRGVTLRLETIR